MTVELTVAQVAAIINVAILLLQATYPLLFALIGVGLLKNKINAATWSVFGKLINNTHWPFLLSTDTSSSERVDKRIQTLTWTTMLAAVILGLAAIATPLGLQSAVKLSEPQNTPFSYVKDTSPIGKATLPRDQYKIGRYCTGGTCPGNVKGWDYVLQHLNTSQSANPWASSQIAANVSNVFTSAMDDSTVASIFDIEYRSYYQLQGNQTSSYTYFDTFDNKTLTQGQFVYFQQFLLNDQNEAVEGVIVSTKDSPGIGFRNHSLPPESKLGYEWQEDILWLEAETECTNLNISLDYTIDGEVYPIDARITDRGGLITLPKQFPWVNVKDAQSDPRLLERSWAAATSMNKLLAELWRVNASYYGKGYYQNRGKSFSATKISNPYPNAIAMSQFGYRMCDPNNTYWFLNMPIPLDLIVSFQRSEAPCNESVYMANFAALYGEDDEQNISSVGTGGGMMIGVGRQVDQHGNFTNEITSVPLKIGQRWSHPIFACLSAVKASVKTVAFRTEHGSNLSDLKITDIRPSNFTGHVWAVEKTRRRIQDTNPLWGLVSSSKQNDAGISTIDRDALYLPAGKSWLNSMAGLSLTNTMVDSMAGSSFPLAVLGKLYEPDNWDKFPDYTGANSWSMYTKWAELSRNESTASQIVNLIWTDLMANAVMGRSTLLQRRFGGMVEMPASKYLQTVAYDWRYASVALVFAGVYFILLLLSMFLYAIRACNFQSLRFFLNQTAAGRSMTTERFEASSEVDLGKTTSWAIMRGSEMVRIGKETVGSREPSLRGYQIVKTKDAGAL